MQKLPAYIFLQMLTPDSISHPEGLGAKLVMKNVLEDAEMSPEEVDYINVHGTSTPIGDL